MSNEKQTLFFRGKTYWFKGFGEPRPNSFNNDAKEWTFELELSKEAQKKLKDLGVGDRIKEPKPDKNGKIMEGREGTKFLLFKQKELRPDGTPNSKIMAIGPDDKPWDSNDLLGNGTVIDVKFSVVDYGKGKPKGIYLATGFTNDPKPCVRVLEHVPYSGGGFEPLSQGDEYYEASKPTDTFKKDFGLDDDIDDVIN